MSTHYNAKFFFATCTEERCSLVNYILVFLACLAFDYYVLACLEFLACLVIIPEVSVPWHANLGH